MTPLLELRGVSKAFGGAIALREIDFVLGAGEIHGLVGENGAGKSTLMKILYGVQKPDDGTISVNGTEVSFTTPADAIAQVERTEPQRDPGTFQQGRRHGSAA